MLALVTGGATRIGKALALHLASAGYDIALHYNTSAAPAIATATDIQRLNRKCYLLQSDLSNESGCKNIFLALQQQNLLVNLLINNAAIFERDTPQNFTAAQLQKQHAINVAAPLLLCQDFFAQPHLEKEHNSLIINMLDQKLANPKNPDFFTYTLSKATLWQATPLLALAFAPHVRVNGIAPGPTLPASRQRETHFSAQCAATPLGKSSTVQDICQATTFLLQTPSITGQILTLDGGAAFL